MPRRAWFLAGLAYLVSVLAVVQVQTASMLILLAGSAVMAVGAYAVTRRERIVGGRR